MRMDPSKLEKSLEESITDFPQNAKLSSMSEDIYQLEKDREVKQRRFQQKFERSNAAMQKEFVFEQE